MATLHGLVIDKPYAAESGCVIVAPNQPNNKINPDRIELRMADELKAKKTDLEGVYAKLLEVQVDSVDDSQPSRTSPTCCAF